MEAVTYFSQEELPAAKLDPLAFFAGSVFQSYDPDAQSIEAADLSSWIDRQSQRIRSVTGELDWDYANGVLTAQSAMCECAMGFFQYRDIQLNHLVVHSGNEYLTVAVVSLDHLPLAESASVLLQVMTEDRFYGWQEQEDTIANTGAWPINVRDILATVTVRGLAVDTVTPLDINGYPVSSPTALAADGRITLARDGIFTVLTRGVPQPAYPRDPAGIAPLPRKHAPTGKADDGWWAFEPAPDGFLPSPMDLRFMNEQAAGQNGFVSREGSILRLGDGTAVRFWAVNVTPRMIHGTHEQVDALAARLAKMGVNMVRMHGPVWDRDSDDLSRVTATTVERYHYFVFAMKRQGIYVKLSYYFPLWTPMKAQYGFDGYNGDFEGRFPFALLQYDQRFQEIYRGWARQLLLPVNPYTGVPLAQEPAVAFIEVQNEDSYLFATFNRKHLPPEQFREVGKLFYRWVTQRYGCAQDAYRAWGPGGEHAEDDIARGVLAVADIDECAAGDLAQGGSRKRLRDQMEFLVTAQKDFYHDMVAFYRREIGTPILLTASNWQTIEPRLMESLERYTYTETDAIDRHGYFEDGHFGENASYLVLPGHHFRHLSALFHPDLAIMQSNRVENWPQLVTETAWPMPNRFKGEAIPLWSLYGALQGFSGIFLFEVSQGEWEDEPAHKWPVLTPAVLGQFPAFARIFRCGMIAEAPPVVRVTHSLNKLYDFEGSRIYEAAAIDALRKL